MVLDMAHSAEATRSTLNPKPNPKPPSRIRLADGVWLARYLDRQRVHVPNNQVPLKGVYKDI